MQRDHYYIKRWSDGYFDINSHGHVIIKPNRKKRSGDLYKLVQTIVRQGISPPLLIKFNEILEDRIRRIITAFKSAIDEFKYKNTHQKVFPIKVNPQQPEIEAILNNSEGFTIGLEVGSKPELIAVIPMKMTDDALLLCNGYKDREYISLALMARKLGKRVIIIIGQISELNLVLEVAKQLDIEPEIGFRMKLSNRNQGHGASNGHDTKFGLYIHEIVDCLEKLKKSKKAKWLKLLHFHVGTQQTIIESIKDNLNEVARVYTEIASEFPSLEMIDVGGGLAVDYDGSRSGQDFSMNYSIEEYARNVVYIIGEACREARIKQPMLVTESGRAVSSYYSVLITEVIDVSSSIDPTIESEIVSSHPILAALKSLIKELSNENCRETFHNTLELNEKIRLEFIQGHLALKERASAEKLYRLLLGKIQKLYEKLRNNSEEFEILNKSLFATYFCNFSVFQSLTETWALGQLFPVMPIHRLNEFPDHQGILADLTCDSYGKINKFIGNKSFLNLHQYRDEPYYLGIFLAGAYEEILGSAHNLFGRANVVHAKLEKDHSWSISSIERGDSITNVLNYSHFSTEQQIEQLHSLMAHSLKAGKLTLKDSEQILEQFKQALVSYTYLIKS